MSILAAVSRPSPGRRVPLATQASSEAIQAVLDRNPTIYYTLDADDAGAGTDQGSAGLSLVENGTVSKSGSGWALADGAWLEVAHDAAFETDAGTLDRWVDSEIAVRFTANFGSLTQKVSLWSKGVGGFHDQSTWVDVDTDGSIVWNVGHRYFRYRSEAPAGTIQADTDHVFVLLFGRDGIQMYVDANSTNDGWPSPLVWEGWDHRFLGSLATYSQRWVNQHPLRLGHNGFDANGAVTIKHFAVFVSGGENADPTVRTGTRFAQTDVDAISETSPTSPIRNIHHAGTVRQAADAAAFETALANSVDGDIIELTTAGTYNISAGDLLVEKGVRIVGQGKASTVIQMQDGDTLRSDNAVWTQQTDNGGDLLADQRTWTVTGHGFQPDDICVVLTNKIFLDAGTNKQENQMLVVDAVSGDDIIFRTPPLIDFLSVDRTGLWRLRPGTKHLAFEELTIQGAGTVAQEGPDSTDWYVVFEMQGIVDLQLRNVDIKQTSAGEDHRPSMYNAVMYAEEQDCLHDTPSTDTGDSTHPYGHQTQSGGYHMYGNCQFESGEWTSYDRIYENSGGSVGSKDGPTDQISHAYSVTIDGSFNVNRPGGTGFAGNFSLSGHDYMWRRDICPTLGDGISSGGGTMVLELVGMRPGKQNLGAGGVVDVVHYLNFRAPDVDNRMYHSSVGDVNSNARAVDIVYSGTPAKMDGTFNNWVCVASSTPNPCSP